MIVEANLEDLSYTVIEEKYLESRDCFREDSPAHPAPIIARSIGRD
jgi:hypothetical protein